MNLDKTIEGIEKAVAELARDKYGCSGVFSFGATDISPNHLAIWIAAQTDSQRDALSGDEEFKESVRCILRGHGYPQEAISHVNIMFESGETVKRDYGGNWWYAVK